MHLEGKADLKKLLRNAGGGFFTGRFRFRAEEITIVPGSYIFIWWLSLVIGLGLIALSFRFPSEQMIFLAAGVIDIGLVSIFLFRGYFRPRPEFDPLHSLFFPRGKGSAEKPLGTLSFSELKSLNIFRRIVQGSKGRTFFRYELKLKLRDGTEYALTCQTSLPNMLEDAEKLSAVLNIPLECNVNGFLQEYFEKAKKDNRATLIAGALFFVIGMTVSFFFSVMPLLTYFSSRDWEETPAVILDSGIVKAKGSKGRTIYRLVLSYRYSRNGKDYFSGRYDPFLENSSQGGLIRKIVKNNPPGKKTVCYVDPSDPSRAILSKEGIHSDAVAQMIFVNFFPVIGLIFLIVGICTWSNLRRMKKRYSHRFERTRF